VVKPYRILLSDKVRRMQIRRAYEYIDAIQSYPSEWAYAFAPREAVEEGGIKLESINPIPATYGAVDFPELYVDEEKLLEELKQRMKGSYVRAISRALEKGVLPYRALPPETFEEVLKENPGVIAEVLFEAFIPLNLRPENLGFGEGWEVEVFRTEVQLIEPRLVEEALKEAERVIDYLAELEQLGESASTIREVWVLAARRVVSAEKTMEDLEREVEVIIGKLSGVALAMTMLFNRLVYAEPPIGGSAP